MKTATVVTFCELELCDLAEAEARKRVPAMADVEASVLITGVQAGPSGELENFVAKVTFSDKETET